MKSNFVDSKCPVVFADANPVTVWHVDGAAHIQFCGARINTSKLPPDTADVSPVVEVVMTLPLLGALQDAINNQLMQLEKQGVFKRIPGPSGGSGTNPTH